ncbi:LIM domain protein isoform X2 [Tasmannia lanceolata]|uniref:LIM domain protein isoform X2 n=1 Tax=Tasmannia lanceolata TaxID=3420 RepID=UPI0040648467
MEMDWLDLSQTQRIVFLVDLQPLIHLKNPNPYITTILTSARKILSFSPLSSSLFAFKLFFSSLSPLLSTSKIHHLFGKSSTSFSFDHPSQTLISLSTALNSLSTPLSSSNPDLPRASLTAGSLRQLLLDYAWEPQDLNKGMHKFLTVRSNLILLFSNLPQSLNCLSEFIHECENHESLLTDDVFCKTFFQNFASVSEGFIDRDIHFCWIDVNFDQQCVESVVVEGGRDECNLVLGFLESAIKGLGWGFCSTDLILLGSALVPFGLIYPHIGFSIGFKRSDLQSTGRVELILEIVDVNGRPLECKFCDLELLDLKLPRGRSADLSGILENPSSGTQKSFGSGVVDCITNIRVKELWRNNEDLKIKSGSISDFLLLRGLSDGSKKEQREISSSFFADKVLELLQMEKSEFTAGKPAWQLLLNFLYKGSCWALVSVSNGDGNSIMGILRPFTVHSAVLCILNSGVSHDDLECDFGRSFSGFCCKPVNKVVNEVSEPNSYSNCSNMLVVSKTGSSSNGNGSKLADINRKRNKKHCNLLQDFTWSSFKQSVLSSSSEAIADDTGCEINLEAAYFATECNNSKKFRFLKCWMKQVKKSSSGCRNITLNDLKPQPNVVEESSLLVVESIFNGSMTPAAASLESCEAFFGSISQKIQQILDSKEVDLGFLAKRLIDSSIHWLYSKLERGIANDLTIEKPEDTYEALVAAEVEKLLLWKPKDLDAKYKGCNSSFLGSDMSSAVYTSEDKVKEHELQILFRMEILQSKVGASLKEASKQKMVKEICSLLWNIDPQGGMFGGESLVEFAGRTIKSSRFLLRRPWVVLDQNVRACLLLSIWDLQ